jgi:hypothetical protein
MLRYIYRFCYVVVDGRVKVSKKRQPTNIVGLFISSMAKSCSPGIFSKSKLD